MRRLLAICLLAFVASTAAAETTRTVFNPFTGKLDYITVLSTTSVGTLAILNQSALQSGATFYTSSGTVDASFSLNYLVANQVPYTNVTKKIVGDSNFAWDPTAGALTLGGGAGDPNGWFTINAGAAVQSILVRGMANNAAGLVVAGTGNERISVGGGTGGLSLEASGAGTSSICLGVSAGDTCISARHIGIPPWTRSARLFLQGDIELDNSTTSPPPQLIVTPTGVVINSGPTPFSGTALSTATAPLHVGWGSRPSAISGSTQAVVTDYPGDSYFISIDSTSGTNTFIGVKGGQSVLGTSSTTWVFPSADGATGQCLKTDGSNNLGWLTPGGGGLSSLEVFTPSAESSPTASVGLFGNDFLGRVIGGTTFYVTLNPATTDFIHNQTTAQSATFNVSSGTASTQFNTQQLHFTAKNCIATALDGTCILSMPDVNTWFEGYNTNVIAGAGTFDYASGPNCMPFPGGGNFNSCVGPYGMSGNIITTAENNNSQGYAACGALRAGFYDSCFGGSSGLKLRDANYCTFSGAYAGRETVDNNGLTCSGFESCRDTTADFVTSVGFQACQSTATVNANITGTGLTCLGKNTGQDIPSATPINYSFAVGDGALYHASGEGQLGGRLGSGREVRVRAASATIETASLNINGVTYLWPGSQASGTKILSNDGSGNLSWATDATGAGGGEFLVSPSTGMLGYLVSTVSGNYTVSSTSTVILADATGASLTVTLPTAIGLTGKIRTIKRLNAGANTVTVATTSSQTIDGATTQVLAIQYTSVDVISDGANWSIL